MREGGHICGTLRYTYSCIDISKYTHYTCIAISKYTACGLLSISLTVQFQVVSAGRLLRQLRFERGLSHSENTTSELNALQCTYLFNGSTKHVNCDLPDTLA